jgi:hypothetical protein
MAMNDPQADELALMLAKSGVSLQDAMDVIHAIAEIQARTGFGKVEVIFEGHEISEIVVSHRRKPKVERRAIKV